MTLQIFVANFSKEQIEHFVVVIFHRCPCNDVDSEKQKSKKKISFFLAGKGLIQKAGVQYIIDTVVQALLQDPSKRFIYVESGIYLFFSILLLLMTLY